MQPFTWSNLLIESKEREKNIQHFDKFTLLKMTKALDVRSSLC